MWDRRAGCRRAAARRARRGVTARPLESTPASYKSRLRRNEDDLSVLTDRSFTNDRVPERELALGALDADAIGVVGGTVDQKINAQIRVRLDGRVELD